LKAPEGVIALKGNTASYRCKSNFRLFFQSAKGYNTFVGPRTNDLLSKVEEGIDTNEASINNLLGLAAKFEIAGTPPQNK